MDTSLKSLKEAFQNQAFSAKYDREPGIYAFMLVTPSDHSAFEDLVGAYEEIHWVTGKHIRVIGPSITVDNARVPRERVASALKTSFDRKCFEEFTVSQTRESYKFAHFIDLPETALPAVVFFDSLLDPSEYVVWSIDPTRPSLIGSFRDLAAHLNEKCRWREIDALRELEMRGTPKLRALESELKGQLSRIQHLTRKIQTTTDPSERQALLDAIKVAERKKTTIAAKTEAERLTLNSAKEDICNRIRTSIRPLDAVYQWNGGSIKRYQINDSGAIWTSVISSATDVGRDFEFTGQLKSLESGMSQPKHSIFLSYARKDNESAAPEQRWLDRLLEHLTPLELQGEVTIWSDKELEIGDDWHGKIQAQLRMAKVAVLLVSSAFLASKYIRNSELPILLKNAKDNGLVILPVIVTPCLFGEATFKYPDPEMGPNQMRLAGLQSANPPSKSLLEMNMGEQHRTLLSIAERILRAVR